MSSEKAVRFLGGDGSSEGGSELIVREYVDVGSILKTWSFVKDPLQTLLFRKQDGVLSRCNVHRASCMKAACSGRDGLRP